IGKAPPPRPGYPVLSDGKEVGVLCSGGVSPSLGCGIALAYVSAGSNVIGTPLNIVVRGSAYPAEVVRKPFV
ncbi:MAG: hypothetical protein KDA89_21900, partial [Planctomycetaceae bacterium]|nr:hypothetical protein [Planctomycetaceae bacterium]